MKKSGKPWYRPRNIVLAILGIMLGGLALTVTWAFNAKPEVTVDYGAELDALIVAAQPTGENGWPALVAAAAAFEGLDDAFPAAERPEGHSTSIEWTIRIGDEDADADAIAFVDRAITWCEEAGVLDHLDDAAAAPMFLNPRTTPLIDLVLDQLSPIRALTNMTAARLERQIEAGNIDEAVRSLRHGLAMSRACTHHSTLIEHLVGFGIATRMVDAVHQAVLTGKPDAEMLAALAGELGSFQCGPITLALEGERAGFLDLVQRLYSDDGEGSGVYLPGTAILDFGRLGGGVAPTTGNNPLANIIGLFLARRAEIVAAGNRYYDEVITAFELTRAEREAATFDPEAFAAGLPTGHFLIQLVAAAHSKVVDSIDVLNCRLGATRLLIAIERHRQDEGAPPATLDSLVPAYMASVPRDPFRGGDFVYRVDPTAPLGYALYSVGYDGTDNGGTWIKPPRAPEATFGMDGSGTDYDFTVTRD